MKKLIIATMAVLWLPLAGARDLAIGVTEFPPFQYPVNGKVIGADTEIVEAVIRAMGHEPRIDMKPWNRVQLDAQSGRLDMVYAFTSNLEREKQYYFTQPLSMVRNVLFKRKADAIQWKTLSDLDKLRIGLSKGYNYGKDFNDYTAAHPERVVIEAVDNPQLSGLKTLSIGGSDVFVCEISVCSYLIRTHKAMFPKLDALDHIDHTVGDIMAFRAGFPRSEEPVKDDQAKKLRDEFNLALEKLAKSGKRKEILKKYGILTHSD